MKNSGPSIPALPFRPKPPAVKPPQELGKFGRALWKKLTEEFSIVDSGGLALLVSICRAEDDVQRMRTTVAADGDIVVDRFGQKVPHPLLAAVSRCETIKRQGLAALHLDIEPLHARPGRPAGR
jgi:hypothetical protein